MSQRRQCPLSVLGVKEKNTEHYRVGFAYAQAHVGEIRRFLWEAVRYLVGMRTGKSGSNESLTLEAAGLLELARDFEAQYAPGSGFGNVMRATVLSNGMSSLAMTTNALPGAISATNTNLAITQNYWSVNTTDDNGKFLPASCTVQDLVEDPGNTTMAEGIEFLDRHENGGYFFLLGIDRDGQIALIQNSPYGKVSFLPKTDYFVTTNHVQLNHDPMPPLANPSGSTYERHERVHTLVDAIKRQHRKVTIADIIAILSDHEGDEGRSICRHEGPGTGGSTVGSIIMFPRSGAAYAALGNPCDTAFELHQLA